jgi:subtilisin family serine protease
MPDQKKSRFELRPVGPWDFDPHLQELIRAQEAGPAISPAITSRPGVADVIVRLKDDAKDKIPAALQQPRRIGGKQSTIVTGEIDIAAIKATRKEVASLKAATKVYLNLHNSIPTIHCDSESLDKAAQDDNGRTFPGLNGADVIVGVVDFGCDFAHKNFLQPSGATRLLYLWDQSDAPPLDSSGAVSPDRFDYGREFNSAKINEALKTTDPYMHLGYTPPLAAHGTHVMDIAAGNGREANFLGGVEGPGFANNPMSHPGVAPNAFLIFVHLKANGNQFLGNSRHLLEAVDYIFDKADRLGLPAVVNLSLSTSGGPHDGTTLVEQGFEELLKQPGRAIVVSAGNAFGQGGHISGTIAGGQTQTLKWHTNPRSSRNEVEVWYPGMFKDLTVALIPPTDSSALAAVPLGKTKDLYDGEVRRGRISHREDDPNNHDNQIDIRVPHLAETQKPWQVVLSNAGTEAVAFHAWIEQNERGTARFDEPTDDNFTPDNNFILDDNFTLGSICCSEKVLTVGAFDTSEMAYLAPPYPATAAGPTRPTGNPPVSRPKPDLSAPGNNILAARAHGGTTVMSGTSMAAAHVTGLVALLFERTRRAGQGPLHIDTTRKLLMAAGKGAAVLSVNDDPRLGSGRIDGAGTLNEFLSVAPPAPPPEGIAATTPVPPEISISDQFRDLIAKLSRAKSFELKVGNNGAPANTKLTELVGMIQQEDFNLIVNPPD